MIEVQDFRAMGEALGDAGAVLRTNAASAGLNAAVPTCPGWSVADLVAHTGQVHRWAADRLEHRPERPEAEVLAEAALVPDLLGWLDDGLVDLLNVLATTPADAEGEFFLPGAPAMRDAGLRRMVHETSVHALDAMAARLGREVAASEVWLAPGLAADGVDEFLTGFWVRDAPLRATPARRVRMDATDAGRSWLLSIAGDRAAVTRVGADEPADATVSGTARELYLGVWNRGGGATSTDPGWWDAWRAHVRVL
jgi:uncharacterized protein (TIGR03083 family)